MTGRWGRILLASLMVAVAAAPAADAVAASPCLPWESVPARSPQRKPAKATAAAATSAVHVFLDGSYSIRGFVRQSTFAHGDFLSVVRQFSKERSYLAHYYRFGGKVVRISEVDADKMTNPAAYECRNCDNQSSAIDKVLNTIVANQSKAETLKLILTDLWLDNKAFTGSPQVALGQPLMRLMSRGESIGVIGIAAPHTGPIVDLPSKYAGAVERPLYVLAIGRAEDIIAFKNSLVQSGSQAFAPSKVQFSLFAPAVANPHRGTYEFKRSGAGIQQTVVVPHLMRPGLAQFRLNRSYAGTLTVDVNPAHRVPEALVWRGAPQVSTRVWQVPREGDLKRCKRSAWRLSPVKPHVDKIDSPNDKNAVRFIIDTTKVGAIRPGTFLIEFRVHVPRVQTPNSQNAWMRRWSINATFDRTVQSARPKFVGTMNLDDLAALLEEQLNRQKQSSENIMASAHTVLRVQ
jgi:hypothetical protein